MKKKLPFIIVRSYGSAERNLNFTKLLFDMQRKYPGLVNEIWFGGSTLDGVDEMQKCAEKNLCVQEECRKLGIRFSFQIGLTLNHGPDWKARAHFPEEACAVNLNGERQIGLLCPTAPEAKDYAQKVAEIVLRTLQPDSLWPDDDLRLSGKGGICFCPRCIKRFNEKYHHHFTQEELVKLLKTDHSAEAAAVRREWTLSNAENLAEFASVYRTAVDNVYPDCMLGIQTVCANWIYDGPDLSPLLKSLSGKDCKEVGIRPGALYYTDDQPRQMLPKSLDIQTEAARCRKPGFIGQICYEAENWPHIAAEKNPYAQMAECSLALASGADSLALYWGTDIHRESDEINRFYFEAVNEYKPFFLAIRDAFADSTPSGISLYRGGKLYEQPEWTAVAHASENLLMENALPVTRPEAAPEAFWLDERAVRELAQEDLPKCFSRAVLMNTDTFEQLSKAFPELKFTKKVRIQNACMDHSCVNSAHEFFECFEGDKLCMHLSKVIVPQDESVKAFSTITDGVKGCGTCLIPTEFGGAVILKQPTLFPSFWNGYRRRAVLNALDQAVGGMSVRLMTDGFSVDVLGRTNADGKTVGAFLLNMGCGRTMPLEFAIRRPAYLKYALYLPGKEAVVLTPVRQTADEMVFRLPGLEAWQPALIAGKI